MGDDKFSELYKKYPKLLPEKNIIDCGGGLYQIIKEMFGAIKIYQDVDLEKSQLPPIVFNSIKIKYGGLEIDYSGGDGVIQHIVDFTKKLSFKTCESCGKIGKLYCSTKWMHWSNKKTLCNKHAVELFYYSIN